MEKLARGLETCLTCSYREWVARRGLNGPTIALKRRDVWRGYVGADVRGFLV